MFGKKSESSDLSARVRAILESDAVRKAAEERDQAEKTAQDTNRLATEGEGRLREAESTLKGLREELDSLMVSGADATDTFTKIGYEEARIKAIRRGLERSPRDCQIALDRQQLCRDRHTEAIKGALRGFPELLAAQERLDAAIAEANKFMREWPEAVHAAFREAGEFFHTVDVPRLRPSDREAWEMFLRLTSSAPRHDSSVPASPQIPVALRDTHSDGLCRGRFTI